MSIKDTLLNGRYRVHGKIGSGGMSTVYRARDETLERWVAVKVLHAEISDQPDQLRRFRHEATSVAQLSHPNVVAVIDAGEDGGHPFIVFEYIEGETLKQRIERLGHLPLDEAVAYSIEVARGLQAAHARRLVHRDVKPQNILIDPEGRAKVTDFGIARSLESDGLTATGRVLGTTDYVSPEQAMGNQVDARSDVYSLGIVLFEMLTGEMPFVAETQVGVAMKHVNEPLPDVQRRRTGVSAALASTLDNATAKDPRRRYRSMDELLRDLEASLEVEVARAGGSHGEATTVLGSVRKRRLPSRRTFSRAGLLLAAAALAAAVGLAVLTLPADERGSATRLSSAQDFDPAPGDGDEHGSEVGLAIDGNPDTAWVTETYQTQEFTSKAGVGVIVDAGKEIEAASVDLRSAVGGWSAEVYAAAGGPPSTLLAWGDPVVTSEALGSSANLVFDEPTSGRYFLVWITALAPAEGGFRVELDEVNVRA